MQQPIPIPRERISPGHRAELNAELNDLIASRDVNQKQYRKTMDWYENGIARSIATLKQIQADIIVGKYKGEYDAHYPQFAGDYSNIDYDKLTTDSLANPSTARFISDYTSLIAEQTLEIEDLQKFLKRTARSRARGLRSRSRSRVTKNKKNKNKKSHRRRRI